MNKIERLNTPNSYFHLNHGAADNQVIDTVSENEAELLNALKHKGVYCITKKVHERTGKEIFDVVYCSSMVYIQSKVVVGEKNYYKVVYFDRDKEKSIYIDAKELLINSTSNTPDIDAMISNGLIIQEKCRGLVLEYLKLQAVMVPEVPGTDKTGWHEGHYIANGFSTTKDIIYAGRSRVGFLKKGDASEQIAFFKQIFIDNPLVFFVTAYCHAGVIGKFMLEGEANPILAITGLSSKGKTTAEMFAISSYTFPENFQSLNGTQGAIENVVQAHRDLFVCLDESGESQIKSESKQSFMYSLSSGRKKARLKRMGEEYDADEVFPEKYSLLICGEQSLLAGIKQSPGVKLRLNELVLSADLMLWESILSNSDAETVNAFIHKNFGHIMPLFIEAVSKDLPLLQAKFQEELDNVRAHLKSGSDIVNRKAKVLAYSYVAARYLAQVVFADEPELINTTVYEMMVAAEKGLFSDMGDFEGVRDEYKDVLANLEETHQQYLKTDDVGDVNKKQILGSITTATNGTKTLMILNNQWETFCGLLGVGDNLLLQYCKDRNILKKDKDGKSTISRNSKRWYQIIMPVSFFTEPDPTQAVIPEILPTLELSPEKMKFQLPTKEEALQRRKAFDEKEAKEIALNRKIAAKEKAAASQK